MAYRNSIPRKTRIILGCRANAGENISKLAKDFNTNRQFIYSQKEKVQQVLHKEFDIETPATPITLNKSFIQRLIFGCMVICKGSTENTQEFIESLFGRHISIGSISYIINEIAQKAKEFNDSMDLSSIKIGAHDEIFQADQAVLVGVEPHSTYIYLCDGSPTRDSTAWGCSLLDKQAQGLNIEMSVNDGGTGLIKGIQEVYPDAKIQSDIFHAEKKLSDYVYRGERAAYKAIREEYTLEQKLSKSNQVKKEMWLRKYNEAVAKSTARIAYYDNLNILYTWLQEVFVIGGYTYGERIYMLEFIISEINILSAKVAKLKEVSTYLMANKVSLLQFVQDIEIKIKVFSEEEEVDLESLCIMWKQLKYPIYSDRYNEIEIVLVNTLQQNYQYTRDKFDYFTSNKIIRASSIVECINSLIRPYLSLKRAVYNNFLPLVQFRLNTRRYRRSRKKDRVKKSPIELLTQKQYPNPLDLLNL